MRNFHQRMMNIRTPSSPLEGRSSFLRGHRDARHAAAEIALEADREIERLQADLSRLKLQLEQHQKSEAQRFLATWLGKHPDLNLYTCFRQATRYASSLTEVQSWMLPERDKLWVVAPGLLDDLQKLTNT